MKLLIYRGAKDDAKDEDRNLMKRCFAKCKKHGRTNKHNSHFHGKKNKFLHLAHYIQSSPYDFSQFEHNGLSLLAEIYGWYFCLNSE